VTEPAYKTCPSCGQRARPDVRFCLDCGADLSAAPVRDGDPYLGLVVEDKYALETLIGEGAMGRVYKARQTTLGKPFAIKILAPHLMNDEASHARFAAEAHNCASLNHPNVVSVVDYGSTPGGPTYIVMEFIEGRTLESIIEKEFPLPRDRIVDLTLQILAALTEAHGLGILHRDLKPENILVQSLRTHGELAKVLDFGIAKLMDRGDERPGLTKAGMVCGTPEYMSPEQARGKALDARSDLYAVGAILYQMLTGRPPFESESAVEILHMHLHQQPIPPSKRLGRPPDPLEPVCLRALSKKPEDRYGSALDFRQEVLAAAAVGAAAASERTCQSCGSPMRAEHKFCPACGAAVAKAPGNVPAASRGPSRARGSGLSNLRIGGESTAEVVVRSFPLPLTDRDAVMLAIEAQLAQPQPALRARVLQGPAGTGKTRLADEIATLGEQRGWRAYYAGSDPTGARTPLWPIRMMVAQLLELDPATLRTQDLGRVANLCGVAFEELPGLAELFGLQGPAFELELAVRRRECFSSAVQAMLSGGRGNPLLMVFDDIDAYDAASREVLRRLASASTVSPILVIATTTESEVQWFGGVVSHIEPLSSDAVREIGRTVIAQLKPASNLVDKLVAASPLSPLSLENQLRLLAAGLDPAPGASDEDLVRARVAARTDPERRVLQAAAVLGERMSEAGLREMVPGIDEEALAQLHLDGLLVSVSAGERAFGHRLIHDVVYADIDDDKREKLHAKAATTSRIANFAVVAKTLHLVRAGDDGSIERLAESARYCERCFDDQSASDLVAAALRLCAARPDPRRLPLEAEMGMLAARTMRAHDQADSAIKLLLAEVDKGHAPAAEAGLRCAVAEQLSRVGRSDDALGHLRKALGCALAGGDPATMLGAYHEFGKLYATRGDLDKPLAELREGLDMCTLGEGPRAAVDLKMWRYVMKIGEVHRAKGDLHEARTWIDHALYQAERVRDRLGLLRAHSQMAWVLRDLKQNALAEQHLARALDEARYFGDRLTTAELLIERARARAARGRLAEARRCCEEALRLARGIQWATGIDHAERAIAMLDRKAAPSRMAEPSERSGAYGR
jgi:serine/threonine protein kinase/tetratricopeptide (TPR) repeat protein